MFKAMLYSILIVLKLAGLLALGIVLTQRPFKVCMLYDAHSPGFQWRTHPVHVMSCGLHNSCGYGKCQE